MQTASTRPSLPKLEDHLRTVLHSRYSVIPFHQTEFISVNYVYHGKLQIDFPDRRHLILQEGQLIFMNSGIVHSLTFRKHGRHCHRISD